MTKKAWNSGKSVGQKIKCWLGLHCGWAKHLFESADKQWLIEVKQCSCCGYEQEQTLRRPAPKIVKIYHHGNH